MSGKEALDCLFAVKNQNETSRGPEGCLLKRPHTTGVIVHGRCPDFQADKNKKTKNTVSHKKEDRRTNFR